MSQQTGSRPNSEVTSANPPEDVKPKTVKPHSSDSNGVSTADETLPGEGGGSPYFLIVKDCEPWQVAANEQALDELGYTYKVITASQLGDWPLDTYTAVVVPSTQSSYYYGVLATNQTKLANYVAQGGVLVAHATDNGWPCTTRWDESYLPNNFQKTTSYDDDLTITASDHPIPADVDSNDIDGVGWSTHGHFDSVPNNGTVVFETDGRPSYIEYPYGAGLVLATMQTLEFQWEQHPQLTSILRNELEYAANGGETVESVEASFTSLSYIPGGNENSTEGGNALNSSVTDFFPGEFEFEFDIGGIDLGPLGEISLGWDVLNVKATPPFDAWGTGDLILDEPPIDYDSATAMKSDKYEEFPGDSFNRYRVRNEIHVEFETMGGETVEGDSISISTDGEGSKTVIEQEQINTLDVDEIGAYEDGGGYYFPSGGRPRYVDQRRVTLDGIEGVQVSTIYGGYTQVAERVAELAGKYDDLKLLNDVLGWEFKAGGEEIDDVVDTLPDEVESVVRPNFSKFVSMLSAVPNIFTFVEFTVLADGREMVRVWDASKFPQHALYLDGGLQDVTSLPYQPQELFNANFIAFLAEASTRLITPYYASNSQYKAYIRHGLFYDEAKHAYESYANWIPDVDSVDVPDYGEIHSHPTEPILLFGESVDGDPLSGNETATTLQSDPFFPF